MGEAASRLLLIILFQLSVSLSAESILFQLKGGDRITGTLLQESTSFVVISTPWNKELSLPIDQIESRQLLPPGNSIQVSSNSATPATTGAGNLSEAVVSSKSTNPVQPKAWRVDAKLGMDLIYGAKDRQIFYGQIALRYARPYRSKPRQFFRNALEYRVDYATTDEVESANRMFGSDKMDFDIGERLFLYNYTGVGFDEVRKIDLQFEVGPGLGCHLFRSQVFNANVESGFSYQLQDRQNSQRIEAMYARVAQDVQWKIVEPISLTQRAALLTRVDAPDQMQLRLEANLGLAIVKNISFNLTAIEMYDTRPVSGVTPNEFQLRSAIGLAF